MDKGDEQESTNNKKTRDLPNLSECQACGFRIDSSTGSDKIQILYSEWRIVLLCCKCLDRIESSKICSYCYKETIEDFLTCSQCERSVHKNCFLKCKVIESMSFLESLICVDCWVPQSLVKRRKFLTYRKICTNSTNLGISNSMVSNGGGSCAVVERKIVFALMASGMKVRKPLLPKKSNALDSEVKRDEGGEIHKKVASDDDAELAFQMHRSMNSSPRISKNLCVVNSSDSHVPKERDYGGVLILRGSGSGSSSSNALKSSGDETSTNFDSRPSYDKRCECTSYKVKVCNRQPDRFFFKYRKRDSRRFLLKYRRRSSISKPVRDNKSNIFLLKYRRRRSSSSKPVLDSKSEIFLLKYRRRSTSSKPVLDNKSDIEICNQKPDRYLFKYRRRDKSS